jgi:hypothetical protein
MPSWPAVVHWPSPEATFHHLAPATPTCRRGPYQAGRGLQDHTPERAVERPFAVRTALSREWKARRRQRDRNADQRRRARYNLGAIRSSSPGPPADDRRASAEVSRAVQQALARRVLLPRLDASAPWPRASRIRRGTSSHYPTRLRVAMANARQHARLERSVAAQLRTLLSASLAPRRMHLDARASQCRTVTAVLH